MQTTPPAPLTEERLKTAWEQTSAMIGSGLAPQTVYENLLTNGIPHDAATQLVQRALGQQPSAPVAPVAQPPVAATPSGQQPVAPATPRAPVTQEQLNEAWQTATAMAGSGVAPQTIYEIITKKGIPHETAMQFVNRAYTETDPETGVASSGSRDMLIGGLWIAGGLIITIGTYMLAENGGRYFITYGPVIYGVIRFFKGVSKSNG
jgi:hypothetical protein